MEFYCFGLGNFRAHQRDFQRKATVKCEPIRQYEIPGKLYTAAVFVFEYG